VFIFAGITGKVLFNNNYVNGCSFCGERHITDTTLMIETGYLTARLQVKNPHSTISRYYIFPGMYDSRWKPQK